MRLSIQRLRWVLVAGALLLVAVLGIYIGSGRYRALKAYRRILARSGVSLTRDSSGVTYSQSLKGRKIFTIRAKSEVSLGDGKYALHNAEMLLYTRSEAHPDHVYGSQMQYDENAGILRADGEVFMDLQPPQGLTSGGRTPALTGAESPKPNQIIHVRTSGLVYVRKLGLATTAQRVEFSYGGMRCTALGAEFNTRQSTLRLLSDVRMDGMAHRQPLHITATRADLDRNANVAHLTRPVATSDGRRATSDAAIVDLRKDGSIERVQGIDHVILSSATEQITANRLDATLSPQSVPRTSSLSGSVVLTGSDPLRPMHGSASVVDAVFNAQGSPVSVTATGAAKLSLIDYKTDYKANPAGLSRSLEGDRIVALFTPGRRRSSSLLKEVHATGSAHAGGQSIAPTAKTSIAAAPLPLNNVQASQNVQALKNVQVWADDLRILFVTSASGKAQPRTLLGAGHTLLQQDAPQGEQETSSGDTLKMVFAAAPPASATADRFATSISSAIQTGDVVIHDRAPDRAAARTAFAVAKEPPSISTGTADRATYDGASQRLTLAGDAHFFNDNASLIAPILSLDQRTQNVDASGGVQAVFQNAPSTPSRSSPTPANARPQPETHILSASAHIDHATQLASFYGTDAHPALLWQGASQVQAAALLFDGIKRTFSARAANPGTLIHAVFASSPAAPKPGATSRAVSVIRIASPKMDYSDLRHEATFSGGVSINGDIGEVRGRHAVLFLSPQTRPAATTFPAAAPAAKTHAPAILTAPPDPFSGSIDRVVVYGSVRLDQPGRHGTGEQLLYTASSGSYVLTGTPSVPPRIIDAQQGTVTGTTLVFSNGGSTIVVSGNPSTPTSEGGRVRSETRVSPAKEERQ